MRFTKGVVLSEVKLHQGTILILLSFNFLFIAGCVANPLAPNLILNLRFSPDAFDSYKRNTSLKYSLLKEAEVSIIIYDSTGRKVKTLIEHLLETKGSHSHGWLGISDLGAFVPTGIYIAKVEADGDVAFASVEIFHF
jgi:hypothetical protein